MQPQPHRRQRTICSLLLALLIGMPATASAADLGQGARRDLAPTYEPQSAAHRQFYVRADLGIGRHDFGGFGQSDLSDNGGSFLTSHIDDAGIVGIGLGANVSPRFRIDLTGEYRSSSQVRALDNITATLIDPAGSLQANTAFTGSMSAYVGLLNGYWDLFTHRGFTPYVGAGIGLAHVRAHPFTTASSANFNDGSGVPLIELSNGHSAATSRTNLAWSLMAGASFDLSDRAKLDVGYRYLDLGSGTTLATGLLECVCGTVGQPLKVSDLTSHDFRIGIRWALDAPAQSHGGFRSLK